jgi:hypothetical protein
MNIDNKGNVHVLDTVGNSKFYFPSIWLDADMMRMHELQEKGVIQFK